jgi:hypothetical protein
VTRLSRQTKRWQAINWLLTGAICLGPAHTALAQPVYKLTDADGSVTFADTPPLSSGGTIEEHAVHAPNTAKPTETTRAPATPVEVEEPTGYDTRIVTPADTATIPMGPGNFAMQAALNPRLAPSETQQLLLDGDPVGAPQRIANWQLTNVYRGEHQLQVVRLDASDAQLDASPASTVYVMRPTVNS